jgi:hypothetical protein
MFIVFDYVRGEAYGPFETAGQAHTWKYENPLGNMTEISILELLVPNNNKTKTDDDTSQ